MTPQSVRMMKDARLLAWPWMAVTSAVLLSLTSHLPNMNWSSIQGLPLVEFGVFAGVPLLAAIGFGAEFQYHTLDLSLAQPIDRGAIWSSKFSVMVLAVLPLAVLFSISQRLSPEFVRNPWMMQIGWMVVTAASAFLWTLVAKSTMGGLALNAGSNMIVLMSVGFAAGQLDKRGLMSPLVVAAFAMALLCYSAAMIWFGRRTFLRFQSAQSSQSAEALMPGAGLLPSAIADWFRCRPTGIVLNLVRREFRMLRFVWPLTLLSLVAWTCLVTFHILPIVDGQEYKLAIVALTAMISVLIALLAGSLSLGEEKSWGTHDWQLTLPISPSLQWAVKLSMAVFTSVLCGALLPMAVLFAAGWLSGNVGEFLKRDFAWLWPFEMAFLSFAAFWCSCLVKGTVRAALLAFPACAAVSAGVPLGQWLAELVVRITAHPFSWLISAMGPIEPGRLARQMAPIIFHPIPFVVSGSIALFGIALIQSHRAFREQAEDRKRRVLRSLAPLFLGTLFASFAIGMFLDFLAETKQRESDLLQEVHRAIENLPGFVAEGPQSFRVTAQQLADASPLSAEAERWIRNSTIVIIPNAPPRMFGDIRVSSAFYIPWGRFLWPVEERRAQASIHRRDPLCKWFIMLNRLPTRVGELWRSCREMRLK